MTWKAILCRARVTMCVVAPLATPRDGGGTGAAAQAAQVRAVPSSRADREVERIVGYSTEKWAGRCGPPPVRTWRRRRVRSPGAARRWTRFATRHPSTRIEARCTTDRHGYR